MSTSSDSQLGAIRLAWWRERLEELGEIARVPAEPRLQAVANELLPRGISGKELSRLEDVWLPLLEPFPWGDAQAEGLALRGRILFGIGARLLGSAHKESEAAGAAWSLADGATHCSDPSSRELLLDRARTALSEMRGRIPRELRPLTVLAAVAVSDLSGSARIRRLAAAIKHRLSGRFPG